MFLWKLEIRQTAHRTCSLSQILNPGSFGVERCPGLAASEWGKHSARQEDIHRCHPGLQVCHPPSKVQWSEFAVGVSHKRLPSAF